VDQDQRVQAAFGKALRKFRTGAGISQERLAELACLNRTYVGDIERGERNVSIVNMQKLARAMKVKLSDVIAEMERHIGR
jgi:transcriptional regulator with XRE-family HTH domain